MARLIGQEGNDTITAGSGSDLIYGKAGDDVLYGNGGNDTINGDAGIDIIYGGSGNDRLIDFFGISDEMYVEQKVYGGDGHDYINAYGITVAVGGLGNDYIEIETKDGRADALRDKVNVSGDDGNDEIRVYGFFEKVDGGSGNDTVYVNANLNQSALLSNPDLADGSLVLDGGSGYDVLYFGMNFPNNVAQQIDVFSRIKNFEEIIVRVSGEDRPSPNVILRDGITEVGGRLTIKCMTEDDPGGETRGLGFVDASQVTQYRLELTLDDIASETNEGFSGAFAKGGSGDDIISSVRIAKLYGGAGQDTLIRSNSNYILIGGAGNDSLIGGNGSDTAIYTGNLSDYTIEEVAYNQYRITDARGALGDGVDIVSGINKLQFSDQTIDVVIRGLNIIGDNSSEVLDGSDDADRISAMGGNDRANGGLGNDWADGGRGNDLVYGGMGNDFAIGGAGNDIIDGGTGDDDLFGGAGRDMLYGGEGEDDFIFRAVNEISNSTIATDTIFGFVAGVDDVDLSVIDASSGGTNNDAFVFRGTEAISASASGEVSLRIFDAAGSRNDYTLIYIDTDADRAAEAVIRLNGVVMLSAGDFIL